MSTAFLDISAALDSSLNTAAGAVPVAWQFPGNAPYTPVTGTTYLRPTLLSGDTFQAELGTTGKDFSEGIYQVDIIAPLNATKKSILDLADDIADAFSRGSTHTYNGVNVRIRRASIGTGSRDGAWQIVPVEISFFVYTAAR